DKIATLFDRLWPVGDALTRPVVLRRRDGGWLQLEERVLLDGSLSMIWIDITKLLALEATNAELDSLVTRLRAPQVQAEAAPRGIHGDPVRLRQVLANLIGNAVKFTARGGIDVRVARWRVADDRLRLRIEVADTGPGIAEAVRPRLFQMFSQGDSSTNRRFG